MKVITIVNNKGGVGKTTSSQAIGVGLARFSNARVLLIDLDAQANLTKCFGVNSDTLKATSGTFILGETPIEKTIVPIQGIDLLPSSRDLANKEDSIKAAPTFPFNLKICLDKIKANYDYVVIDCPPAISGMTKLAVVACDVYFVPLQAEFLSYEGLRNLLNFTNEIKIISPNIKLGGVFATRYNPKIRKNISNELIANVKNQLNEAFLSTSIRESIALSEAQASGLSIFEYAAESNGAKDYYNLTKEIITKL